jgi:hypothetical protein
MMKQRCPLQFPRHVIAGIAVLLAGCAHFEQQTGELEPHGLVVVVKPTDFVGEVGLVKRFDGLAVSAGKTYRVRPGEHTVVVQFVETMIETSQPATATLFSVGTPLPEQPANVHVSESGEATVTGQQPFPGMQMANLSIERRRVRYATNAISVQAGWRYELEGDRVTAKQSSAPGEPHP